jgi:hypothetical protein
LRNRARVVASFAEYLAEDVEAMGELAEWCEGDPELLAHARTKGGARHTCRAVSVVENNRHATQLLDLVRSARSPKELPGAREARDIPSRPGLSPPLLGVRSPVSSGARVRPLTASPRRRCGHAVSAVTGKDNVGKK